MKSRVKIIPAILAQNAEDFQKKFAAAQKLGDWIQIDIMDGTLVPQKSWAEPDEVSKIAARNAKFELHLMVDNPVAYIAIWNNVKSVGRAVAHIEAFKEPDSPENGIKEFVRICKSFGWNAGLAINPETDMKKLLPYVDLLSSVLVMGVHPGAAGQKMIEGTETRLKELADVCALHRKSCPTREFDGGANEKTISKISAAGANIIIVNIIHFL